MSCLLGPSRFVEVPLGAPTKASKVALKGPHVERARSLRRKVRTPFLVGTPAKYLPHRPHRSQGVYLQAFRTQVLAADRPYRTPPFGGSFFSETVGAVEVSETSLHFYPFLAIDSRLTPRLRCSLRRNPNLHS